MRNANWESSAGALGLSLPYSCLTLYMERSSVAAAPGRVGAISSNSTMSAPTNSLVRIITSPSLDVARWLFRIIRAWTTSEADESCHQIRTLPEFPVSRQTGHRVSYTAFPIHIEETAMKRIILAVVLVVSMQAAAQSSLAATASSNPKVRAITGFVRLDRATYQNQIADALVVLRGAKAEFESRGYAVETLRLTTQPLGELVAGLSEEQALAFLAQLDELSVKENFLPNVGPGMLRDTDDPAVMHLLERALSTLPHITASTVIADESGIHWRTISRTA